MRPRFFGQVTGNANLSRFARQVRCNANDGKVLENMASDSNVDRAAKKLRRETGIHLNAARRVVRGEDSGPRVNQSWANFRPLPIPDFEVPRTLREAAALYHDLRIGLGLHADGSVVQFNPAHDAQLIVAGATGSGRSSVARGVIEAFRAAGSKILVAEPDLAFWATGVNTPNVLALADTEAVIQAAMNEIVERRASAGAEGAIARDRYPACLVVLNEIHTLEATSAVLKDVLDIMQMGRWARVHLLLCADDSDAWISSWAGILGQIPLAVLLDVWATRLASTLLPAGYSAPVIENHGRGRRGHGVSVYRSPGDVCAFRPFVSQHPSLNVSEVPTEIRREWERYRTAVTDEIVPLYAPAGARDGHHAADVRNVKVGNKVYEFGSPQLASAVRSTLDSAEKCQPISIREALVGSGFDVPSPGQAFGQPVEGIFAAKPGDVIISSERRGAWYLGGGTVLTELGEIKPVSEVMNFTGTGDGLFTIAAPGSGD